MTLEQKAQLIEDKTAEMLEVAKVEMRKVIKKAILSTHGKTSETYKTAKAHDLRKDGEADEMIRMLSEDYRILLQGEYDYKISTEAIQETIEANQWEFTEEGEMI